MYLGYLSSIRCGVDETLFPLWRLLFCAIGSVFFRFIRFNLLILDLNDYAINILFKKLSLEPMYSRLFPVFFSVQFKVNDLR